MPARDISGLKTSRGVSSIEFLFCSLSEYKVIKLASDQFGYIYVRREIEEILTKTPFITRSGEQIVINFFPESNLSINENRSTSSVGVFFEIYTPKIIAHKLR